MKRNVKLVAVFLFFFLLTINQAYADSPDAGGNPHDQYAEGELLVKFKPGTPGLAKSEAHRGVGASVIKDFQSLRLQHVELPKGLSVQAAIESYEKNPNIEYAEPNYIVSTNAFPNDSSFSELWGMHNTGQTGGTPDADIDAPEAWDITTGSSEVVVAVIDTGVDYTHEDLAQNMWVNDAEYYGTSGIDDDANGYVDDIYGIDAMNGDSDPMDDNSHGTHVSGTIGAVGNNGIGVAGVNWNAKILACKFLDAGGSGDVDGAITCLEYIRSLKDSGVNVVASNNSWGGGDYSQALYDAIYAQQGSGILLIAAAGNMSMDNDEFFYSPASYYLPNIISVAAIDHNDGKAVFSSFGDSTVHIGAPGKDILSTVPNNMYDTYSGTSMATPHVAGLAALVKSQDMSRDWVDIKNLILSGGTGVPSMDGITITGSRLNAHGSLACTDGPVFSALRYPAEDEIGVPATLAALSINCAAPVGPVTVTMPGGGVVELFDDGMNRDLVPGDGIFSGEWTFSGEPGRITFSSPAGTDYEAPFFTIDTSSRLQSGQTGVPYSQTLEASGGVLPYTWSIPVGGLPAGLTLNSATGEISGVPATDATAEFYVRVTDAESSVVEKFMYIRINDDPLRKSWDETYNGPGDDYAEDVAFDSSGNVYVAGYSYNGVNNDYVTIKYNSSGNVVWTQPYDSGHDDYSTGIAVDSNGNVYVAGYSYDGPNHTLRTVKYDQFGDLKWERTRTDSTAHGIAVDDSGNVYVTGGYSYFGLNHCVTVKYDSSGNEISVTFDEPAIDLAEDIAVDGSGNVYIAGTIFNGQMDYHIVKYSPSGVLEWEQTYDSGYDEMVYGLAVDQVGNVYVTGEFDNQEYGYDVLTVKYDTNGNFVWDRPYDYMGSFEYGRDVTVDEFGFVYVSGYSLYFDEDYLILKYDPSGNVVWSKTEDFTQTDRATAIAVDGNGYVYVTGSTHNGVDFDFRTVKFQMFVHVTTISLADGTTGTAYSQFLEAGYGAQPYTWSIPEGYLPYGLTLNSATGEISGMPSYGGTYYFTVEVTDADGETDSKILSIFIYEPVSIGTPDMADGMVGAPYVQDQWFEGGIEPYTWSITSGSLPTGLTLDNATGRISSTPTTAGTFSFTLQLMDGYSATDTKVFSISIYEPLTITTSSLPDGYAGTSYSQTLAAAGGKLPYSWAITSGSLPGGLSLDSVTGGISGTPTTPGTSSFTVQVTDANSTIATRSLSITVYDPVDITTTSLSYGVTGRTYSEGISATGGLSPYTWSIVAGVLPDGLTLDGASGVISGTPTTSGMSNFTVQAMDANGETATQALSILIYDAVTVDTVSLPYGVTGRAYSDTLSASGGVPPYTWSIVSGSLPDGLSLDGATGAITGTPTMTGVFNFTVQATDDIGETGSRALSIAVYDPVSISTTSLPNGDVGTAYNEVLAASGGLTPYSWSITAGSLPDGLSLDGVAGVISGTPTTVGIFDFTVGVADANAETASQDLSITVGKTTTYYVLTASNCSAEVYSQGPQYGQLGSASGDCSVGDTVRRKFKGGPNDMLVGYLANGGYATDMAITGAAMGNDLSFFINGSGGTGYIHLAEVNPTDGTVIQVLSTVSVSISPDTLTSVTNISALTGTVSAGNTVGIVLSMTSTERNFNEITWGTTGGGPGLEQWFTVTETPLGSASPPANNPPVAAANGPYSGTVNTPVAFSSSGSDDPDGDTLTYLWDFGDGNTSTEANPTHTYTSANTYTVTLTVTDPSDASDTDTTTATITDGTNQPPVADAGPDKAAQVRETITFDGSGSYDPDGSISSYSWDFGDNKTASGITVSHDYNKEGTYTVTLTVTDNQSATAQDTAVVTVSK